MAGATEGFSNKDLQRLCEIEQHVVSAVDVAAKAVEEMSKMESMDKALVKQLTQQFVTHIKDAQDLVHKAVSQPVTDRGFEATVYHYMARAYVAAEKVGVVATGLDAMAQAAESPNALENVHGL